MDDGNEHRDEDATGAPDETPRGSEIPPLEDWGPDRESRTLAMMAHLLGAFTGFVGPLVVWMLKRETDAFVDDQAKEAINFQLTILMGWAITVVAMFVWVCGAVLLGAALGLAQVICAVAAAVKAQEGEPYRYPFAIRLIS